jgi:hypothetical protein
VTVIAVSYNGTNWYDCKVYWLTAPDTNICIKALGTVFNPQISIKGKQRVCVGARALLQLVTPPLIGEATYEWYKDDVLCDGVDGPEYDIPLVTFWDAGVYRVLAHDESKSLYESDLFVLEVLPEGSLPAASYAALMILVVTIGSVWAWRSRRHGENRGK